LDSTSGTSFYKTTFTTYIQNRTCFKDSFDSNGGTRVTEFTTHSQGSRSYDITEWENGSSSSYNTTDTFVDREYGTLGSSPISMSTTPAEPVDTITLADGYIPFVTTVTSNYNKTTQQTGYLMTVPAFSDGECSTATTTLTGAGIKKNISDNFTTSSNVFSLNTIVPSQYGTVNSYHVSRDNVLFTGQATIYSNIASNSFRFSDVYQSISETSYSYRLESNKAFASSILPQFYEFINPFTVLILRPIILGTWTDSDISTSGSFWAGFGNSFTAEGGNSFTAEGGSAYKTLTTSSSGDTWDASNLLQTSDIGNPIEDAGPRIIQTGCLPWTQDGTTAWSVPVSTVQSSTESTLLATYSSTVSTSRAEGQPTTSTRSDKYATYTLGLDSIAASSDTTTTVLTFLPSETSSFGRDNAYSSKQTLVFSTGLFITSTENNGGADTVGTMTLNQTNGTFSSSVQIGLDFSTTEIFSGWTRELDQGAVINMSTEAIYEFKELSSINAAFAINTNLAL